MLQIRFGFEIFSFVSPLLARFCRCRCRCLFVRLRIIQNVCCCCLFFVQCKAFVIALSFIITLTSFQCSCFLLFRHLFLRRTHARNVPSASERNGHSFSQLLCVRVCSCLYPTVYFFCLYLFVLLLLLFFSRSSIRFITFRRTRNRNHRSSHHPNENHKI